MKHTRYETGPRAYKTESPKYRAVHARIVSQKGKAMEYQCRLCKGRAEQWAFDHSDRQPLTEIVNGARVKFTTDLDKYIPLCRSCHTRFDNNPPAFGVIGKRKVPDHED